MDARDHSAIYHLRRTARHCAQLVEGGNPATRNASWPSRDASACVVARKRDISARVVARKRDASGRVVGARSPLSDCAPSTRPTRAQALQGSVTLCQPFGSPQVCGLWSHSANPNQVERKAWTRVFAPLLPLCTKSAGGEQGRARQAAPVGCGRRGMWVPGSQVSRPSGSLAAGMKLVRPCSRHRLAPRLPYPATQGMPHALRFFQRLAKRSCSASPCASYQLRFFSR